MSPSTAVRVTRPVTRPARRPGAARLRAVTAPASVRSRAGLVMGCLGLLAVGLLGLLLLNMSLEKGAFVRRSQQAELERLIEQRQALTEELAALEAPQSLAVRAAELGMVQAPNAAFVRPRDGKVLGVPSPGVASQSPSVTIRRAPAAGRGTSAGPAASLPEAVKATAGTAGASAKVTATRKVAATTTAVPGTSAGQGPPGTAAAGSERVGVTGDQAPTGAGAATTSPTSSPTREVARTPATTAAAAG